MSDRNKSSTFETSRERSRAEQPNTAMDTDFTQDTMLHFLQSSGGSVRNSDLLLHFRGFIRDHADRDRNRELFKKFVNSVATVQQVDGVSYVVLRKKFRGHVPGSGERGSPRAPAGKNTEPSEVSARQSPAGRAENPRQKPQKREVTTPAGATVLPAAGIILNNNNNNVETNLNLKQKQVVSTPAVSGRPAAAAQVRAQTPRVPQPPAQDKHTEVGQQSRGLGPPPAVRPVASAGRRHGETCQQPPVPEPRRGRPEGGLHQEPPLHPVSLLPQVALRRKYRQSYKAAVSYDEDDDEEEEEIQTRRGSTGGVWPMSTSLGDSVRAMSASSPCIIDQCIPPSVVSSSSSSSSERPLPKIYIQNVKGEMLPSHGPHWSLESGLGQRERWAGPGLEPGSVPELVSNRRSLPPETGSYTVSPDREKEVVHHIDVHTDPRYSQPAGVQTEPRQGPGQNHRVGLSSSHSSLLSPEAGLSSGDWPLSGSTRGSGWNGSNEELQSRAGKARADSKIQEALQRVHRTADSKSSAPWHHSAEHLHVEQEPTARVLPWRLSTGDLYDDRGEAESSEGSPFSSPLRPRPTVAGRMSSQLRNRMCRSLGADLDQLLQEEARGGSEAARLNRLQLISSTLSLPYNLSSSSLSSCSTPPRCHSLADLVERVEGREGRRSLTAASSSTAHHEGPSKQSLVPLEPREHAWLVKGAAGAWPDIYSLFREDSSLLNRRDFISGFTVLHWIAKHGDHRVLNTLWYGVEKAGLTFDINARSTSGHTPLHIAAIHSHKNVIRLLVSKFNADVRLRDTAGKKPWQYLSRNASSDVFELLGAPSQAAGSGEGGVVRADSNVKPEQHHRRRRRHHFSSAASGKRPVTTSGTMRVKRSSSLAAFLKHKSLHRFHGQQSDSSV